MLWIITVLALYTPPGDTGIVASTYITGSLPIRSSGAPDIVIDWDEKEEVTPCN